MKRIISLEIDKYNHNKMIMTLVHSSKDKDKERMNLNVMNKYKGDR